MKKAPTRTVTQVRSAPGAADGEQETELNTQLVYCYVDVLAARNLPVMDAEGAMDPKSPAARSSPWNPTRRLSRRLQRAKVLEFSSALRLERGNGGYGV